jgi:hypothetical protein
MGFSSWAMIQNLDSGNTVSGDVRTSFHHGHEAIYDAFSGRGIVQTAVRR